MGKGTITSASGYDGATVHDRLGSQPQRAGASSNFIPRFLVKLVHILAACALTTLMGCVPPSAPPADDDESKVAATGFTEEYRIGVGDTLAVNVWRNEDLSIEVPVRPDGKISVPLAGDVDVGGKTPEEVGADINKRLATYIRDPYVTVIVTNMGSADFRSRVRVTGAVKEPQSIPYRQGMTVLDLVLEAGGLSDFANPGRAVLYHRNGARKAVALNRILNNGDMATNFPLRPGDVITVPERIF